MVGSMRHTAGQDAAPGLFCPADVAAAGHVAAGNWHIAIGL